MIEQPGRIEWTEAGRARVAVGPRGGCSACDAGQGCGAGLFGRLLRRKPLTLVVSNPEALAIGRAVVLGIPELLFLRLVLRLYALPLAAGLAGAWICHQISVVSGLGGGQTDLFSLAGLIGFAGLALRFRRGEPHAASLEQQVVLSSAPQERVCAAAGRSAKRQNISNEV